MSEPFLGEVRIMSFNFAPRTWAPCDGALLPINQNLALFSLLGTTFGGDGRVNFALPDLRGRAAMHFGDNHSLGERAGQEAHSLLQTEMPAHVHAINADSATAPASNLNTPSTNTILGQSGGFPGNGPAFPVSMYGTSAPAATLAPQTISNVGGSQAHLNRQPYLGLTFCIALQGIFPSQN